MSFKFFKKIRFEWVKKIKMEVFIFLGFVLSRLPKLGYDIFNTDVWKWKQRIYDFGSGVFYLDFAKTFQKYHPGVTLMWLGSIGVKINNFIYEIRFGSSPPDDDISAIFQLHMMQKLMVVIAIGIALAFVYNGFKKAVSRKIALIAVVLISLEPFYIALTRVIHLEGLLSTFMLASVVWFYIYIQALNENIKCKKELIISAVFTALAILTKTPSLILLPFAGLALFFNLYSHKKKLFNILSVFLKKYFTWLGVVILVMFLIWPALWVTPVKVIEALFSGVYSTGIDQGHIQLYMGKWVTDPGPFFYLVVFLLRSSLYVILGFILFPFIFKMLDKKEKNFIFYIVIFGLVYLVEMTIPSKKLDRYLLPSILSFSVVSSFVVDKISIFISGKINTKFAWFNGVKEQVITFLLILPAFVFAVWLHPNYFSYYNPMFGGLKKGIFMLEPKWAFAQDRIVDYLEKTKKEDNLEGFYDETLQSLYYKDVLKSKLIVAFPEKYYTQLWPFVRGIDGWATIESLAGDATQTNYFVYPVWFEDVSQKEETDLVYRGSIYLRDVKLYNVYNNMVTR